MIELELFQSYTKIEVFHFFSLVSYFKIKEWGFESPHKNHKSQLLN